MAAVWIFLMAAKLLLYSSTVSTSPMSSMHDSAAKTNQQLYLLVTRKALISNLKPKRLQPLHYFSLAFLGRNERTDIHWRRLKAFHAHLLYRTQNRLRIRICN